MVYPPPRKCWARIRNQKRMAQCTSCCVIRRPAIGFLIVAPREARRQLRSPCRRSNTDTCRYAREVQSRVFLEAGRELVSYGFCFFDVTVRLRPIGALPPANYGSRL